MAFLQFILYVVIFFGISTITQIIYSGVKRTYRFNGSWVGHIFAMFAIGLWMITPSHWTVLVLFSIVVGISVSEKEKIKQRKLF